MTKASLAKQWKKRLDKVSPQLRGYDQYQGYWESTKKGKYDSLSFLRSARASVKRVHDPLAVPAAQRYGSIPPMDILQRTRRDVPGLLVGFEVEAAGTSYTSVMAGGPLPLLAPRAHMEHCGVEVPVLCRMDNLKALYEVCRRIKAAGGKISRDCGGHVHLDVRDMFSGSTARGRNKFPPALKASVTRLCTVVESVFRYAVPPSRVGNRFCVLGGLDWTGNDRYRAVNCASLTKHRTIEVRLGAGSLNPDKWRLWACCLVWALRHPIHKDELEAAKTVRDAVGALDWIMKSSLPPIEKWWLVCRIRKFHPSALPKFEAGANQDEGGEY